MKSPTLSVIVIVYDMPRQAMNTLYSLSTEYQQGIDSGEYEVLVLENDSGNNLDSSKIDALQGNFHYYLRQETRPTPVYAINEGLEKAKGHYICLMIDGARMVTPRMLEAILAAFRMNPHSLVAVPGYHLGEQNQKYSLSNNYTEATEIALLESIQWPQDAYRLFDISCYSASNLRGYFQPMLESNCISCSKQAFTEIGGAHEGFQSPGGGSVNLDIYMQLGRRANIEFIILAGEGSFHQIHGGVTTRESVDLEEVLASHREEFKHIRGEYYSPVLKEPSLLGSLSGPALQFLNDSSKWANKRYKRLAASKQEPWPDDDCKQ
jgi:glycosyltransferase involved in cell wall biosynthesis